VSFGETVLLGALAGFTIYLGLPFGRIEFVSQRARVGLAMFSVGVLAFLFAEVFVHGLEIVEHRFDELHDGSGSLPVGLLLGLLFGGGFTAGLAGLALIESRMRNAKPPPIAGGATDAMTVEQAEILTDDVTARARALRTGMAIAAAIGLHNFAEGLAIGVSANTGEIGLATVLIIGFAVHNATEGFGIVGPFSGIEERPSWPFLLVVGLIGGGPTFFGTLIGQTWVSEAVSIAFLALAAGSILYVVIELLGVCRNLGHKTVVAWGITLGLMLGFATDFVLVAAGA
jgi:ZIP family zinc transporter